MGMPTVARTCDGVTSMVKTDEFDPPWWNARYACDRVSAELVCRGSGLGVFRVTGEGAVSDFSGDWGACARVYPKPAPCDAGPGRRVRAVPAADPLLRGDHDLLARFQGQPAPDRAAGIWLGALHDGAGGGGGALPDGDVVGDGICAGRGRVAARCGGRDRDHVALAHPQASHHHPGAGIYMSRRLPQIMASHTRLRLYAVWDALIFLLNGLVFILIGLQLPLVLGHLRMTQTAHLVRHALLICLIVIVLRIVWVFVATYWPRRLFKSIPPADPAPPRSSAFIIAWTGSRRIVSLAAALALPLTLADNTTPFPHRDLLIFLTFAGILL